MDVLTSTLSVCLGGKKTGEKERKIQKNLNFYLTKSAYFKFFSFLSLHFLSIQTKPLSPLAGAIRPWMSKDWRVVLHHVLRQANTAADLCAAFGYGMALGVHKITIPPPAFWLILRDDIRGVLLPRNCVL